MICLLLRGIKLPTSSPAVHDSPVCQLWSSLCLGVESTYILMQTWQIDWWTVAPITKDFACWIIVIFALWPDDLSPEGVDYLLTLPYLTRRYVMSIILEDGYCGGLWVRHFVTGISSLVVTAHFCVIVHRTVYVVTLVPAAVEHY